MKFGGVSRLERAQDPQSRTVNQSRNSRGISSSSAHHSISGSAELHAVRERWMESRRVWTIPMSHVAGIDQRPKLDASRTCRLPDFLSSTLLPRPHYLGTERRDCRFLRPTVMTSALPTPRPLFEPTDLLGPLPLPTPPHVTDADSKDGDDVHMEEGHVRPGELRMESPPPDFEYEPSDLEDEVKALMKSEQRDKPSFTSSRILDFDEPPISLPQPPALTPGTSLIEYHGAKLMSSAASRITLTPPLDIDTARLDHLLNEPEPCFLPPLRAETASGSNISFKRRTKPKPPVSPLCIPTWDVRTNQMTGRSKRFGSCRRNIGSPCNTPTSTVGGSG